MATVTLLFVRFNVRGFYGAAAIHKSFISENLDIEGNVQYSGHHCTVDALWVWYFLGGVIYLMHSPLSAKSSSYIHASPLLHRLGAEGAEGVRGVIQEREGREGRRINKHHHFGKNHTVYTLMHC